MTSFEADLSIGAPETPQVGGSFTDEEPLDLGLPPGDASYGPTAGPDVFGDLDAPEVDEAVVESLLREAGELLCALAADEDVPDQWRFTAVELRTIVPPLTRIINRRPALRRMVAKGDGVFVVLGLTGYGRRNLMDGHKARQARGETDGNQHAEGPGDAPGHHRGGDELDRRGPDDGWSTGVAPDEAAGVGVFQG